MRLIYSFAITAILFASADVNSAWATTLKVGVTAVSVSGADLIATVSLKPAAASDATERTRSVRIPGEASFDVQPGQWLLRIDLPGYLSTSRSLIVASGKETTERVALVPSTKVDGTIRLSKGDAAIDVLTLSYRFVALPSEGMLAAETIDCVLKKSEFECLAPSGTLDYNLHARGHASIYRWGETLVAGKTTHLGPITLIRGASLVGRVIPDRGVRIGASPIEVVLAPIGFAAVGALADRQKLHERRTKANAKGFFQFDGLPPGQYQVRAQATNLISHSREISIVDTFEAELRDPLVLAPPKRLGVTISPSVDPSGLPWTVELWALNSLANYRHLVKKTQADVTGAWTATDVVPGEYMINVRREPQASWFSKIVEITDDDEILVDVGLAKVSGRVTRDGEPVQAFLWFGGDRSTVSIPVRTGPDGEYSTVLPTVEDNTWREIDVAADAPPIRRALYDVKLTKAGDSSDTFIFDIDLPARGIFGQVTDKDSAVAGAQVFLARDDLKRTIDVDSRQDGSYAFDGLEPGGYSVRAMLGNRRSKAVHIVLTESDKGQPVDLPLLDLGTVTGRLVSAGRAIGAGRVWAIPPDRYAAAVIPTETSVDGSFSLTVPAEATHAAFVAVAPGFGLSFGDLAMPTSDIELQITSHAATLEVEALDSKAQLSRGLLPIVIHRGTFMPVGLAASLSGTAEVSEAGGVHKTRLAVEPGEYSVCFARQIPSSGETLLQTEKCVAGTAISGAVLTLRVSAPESGHGEP